MMTLYDYLPSQNAWKVRQLLHHLQTPYQQKLVSIFEGEGQHPDYLNINPTGAVPALELEDGRVLAESNAILTHLASGSDYLPNDPLQHSKVLQWLFFEADYVQSSVATLRHWRMTGKDANRPAELLTMMHASSMKVMGVVDKHLASHQFLAADAYTIADISVFAYTHLADEARVPLADFVHVRRWIDAVRQQPRFLNVFHGYSIDPFSGREL